jgi:hypothetical protein
MTFDAFCCLPISAPPLRPWLWLLRLLSRHDISLSLSSVSSAFTGGIFLSMSRSLSNQRGALLFVYLLSLSASSGGLQPGASKHSIARVMIPARARQWIDLGQSNENYRHLAWCSRSGFFISIFGPGTFVAYFSPLVLYTEQDKTRHALRKGESHDVGDLGRGGGGSSLCVSGSTENGLD